MEGGERLPSVPPTFPQGLRLGKQPPSLGSGLLAGGGDSSPHSPRFLLSPTEGGLGGDTCCSYLFLLGEFCRLRVGPLAILLELLLGKGWIGGIIWSPWRLPHPPPGPPFPHPTWSRAGADISVWWRSVLPP